MKNYRYSLEPYKGMNSRYTCPSCNQKRKYTRYIDTKTGELLPEKYGKCERLDKCGYHLSPYKDGYSQRIFELQQSEYKTDWTKIKPQPRPQSEASKPVSPVPFDLFKQSLQEYETNNFVQFLIKLFGTEITTTLVSKYFIGTSKHQFRDFSNYKSERGANIFWQIDITGKIRAGKIMLYSQDTGKRVKNPFNHITWVHKVCEVYTVLKNDQCFYGEQLLKGNTKPVAIVESEKTAIIASVYFPAFIWIAAGNLTGLNFEKCKALAGRKVLLFPDLSRLVAGKKTSFEKWSDKAKEFSSLAKFTVNDLLERKACEKERISGCDLADYLIKFDYKEFIDPEPKVEKIKAIDPVINRNAVTFERQMVEIPETQTKVNKFEKRKTVSWCKEIAELEKYFSLVTLPDGPVKLNSHSIIADVSLFLQTHFATLKENEGNKIFLPFLTRLQDLKQILT